MNKKFAVIGCGRLGALHAKIYAGNRQKIDLTSLCDTNIDRARGLSEQLNTAYANNYRQLLGKVDAVSIATPTVLHYKIANDFLQCGSDVLIEKPIAKTVPEANSLIKIAKRHKRIIQVGHVERFNAAFTAIKDKIKLPRFIECHRLSPFPGRSLDIGVVEDLMIHDIDIILGLIKSKIKRIDATGINVLTAQEDIANARLTFANGCVCNLTASRISDETMRKIRIFLKNTYISLDYCLQEAFIYKKTKDKITKELLPIEKEQPLQKEIAHFIDCVYSRRHPLVSGTDGRDALALALKIKNKIWAR